ncbi:MAG: tetratricopeptide repeat protein [Methylococcales bacterium]|nr:tetratricopeptide repeat protein [Methylococcales bacterium]
MLSSETMDGELDGANGKLTAISPEVLYLLMTAEIAGQRNQYGVALDGYLQAAKRVDDARLAERAAKIGLFLKKTEQTDEAVALWLKQDKGNLTARKIAVLSALRSADKESSLKHLNALLQDDPAGFESILIELVKALGKESNPAFMYSVLEELAAQHRDQAAIFYVQAMLAGQLKRQGVAKEKVDKALELQPNWNKALILSAQLAAQTGDFVLARKRLEKVLKKVPENHRVRKMLTQVLIKSGKFDEAVEIYQAILEEKPDDGDAQFAIALIYLQQKKEDKATVLLEKLVNKPKWDAQASFFLGRIEFKKLRYERALVWFDKVTQGPYVYDASMAAVSVLLNQKNFNEAKKRVVRLAAIFPTRELNTLLLKAEIYNAQKKYQQAFDLLTQALVKSPEHRDLLYTRALIAERVARLDILEQDLKKILLQNPNDVGALNALGYTLADRTDRYEEAEKYLLQAIKLKPEEAVIIDSMGWLLFKKGQSAEAIKYLRDAYNRQPESEIAAHLAEVLWVEGNKTEAKEIFDKAIKQSPDDEYLLKFKQQFLDAK